jgi:hypothetical protein
MSMGKIGQYQRAIAYCRDNAERARDFELRQLWTTIEESYRFLIDLEAAELSRRLGEPYAGP